MPDLDLHDSIAYNTKQKIIYFTYYSKISFCNLP